MYNNQQIIHLTEVTASNFPTANNYKYKCRVEMSHEGQALLHKDLFSRMQPSWLLDLKNKGDCKISLTLCYREGNVGQPWHEIESVIFDTQDVLNEQSSADLEFLITTWNLAPQLKLKTRLTQSADTENSSTLALWGQNANQRFHIKKEQEQVKIEIPASIPLPMSTPTIFKWRHFQAEIILLNRRWYCRYALSERDLEEMMPERGVEVDHSTINRWVLKYAPELDKRIRPHLRSTNDSWRVDETYIKVKGRWKYLYWAVDSLGNTLDFLLSAKRDATAAERFLRKTLNASHTQEPRVINVDKNAAYPPAVEQLQADEQLPTPTQLGQVKYLNNRVEQDHRFIKRLTKPGLGFGSFNTARRTLRGFEAINMVRKGQVQGVKKGNARASIEFVSQIFGVA